VSRMAHGSGRRLSRLPRSDHNGAKYRIHA
jgi:hypothetical protein